MTDLQSNAKEINRLAYLDAMGVDSYVSRHDLPAAAPSRRLCIVPRQAPTSPVAAVLQQSLRSAADEQSIAASAPQPSAAPAAAKPRPPAPVSARALLGENLAPPVVRPAAPEPAKPMSRGEAAEVPVFSLGATCAGGWYWLDDIPPGRSLGPEYLQLITAICQALLLDKSAPVQEQFNWPQGTAGQLDRGIEAAQASLGGFLSGRIERLNPAKIILLGELDNGWFNSALLPQQPVQISVSAWRMLREPQLKRQAWSELKLLMADAR